MKTADKIQYLKGVGPRRAALLGKMGIHAPKDAALHFPMRYEDRRLMKKIAMVEAGRLQSIQGRVLQSEIVKRGRLNLFELILSDGSALIRLKWFNQPYMKKRFKVGDEIIASGVVKRSHYGIEMENPEYEFCGGGDEPLIHTARIVPVYRTTEGLSVRQLRNIIYEALENYCPEDPLPEEMLKRRGLPPLSESLANVHFPGEGADVEALNEWRTAYQKRLSFEEFFMLQAGLAVLRKRKGLKQGIRMAPKGVILDKLVGSLPFRLTDAQIKAATSVIEDMKRPHPMQRLLQGDVGCGKTVVALMGMLSAVECGYQTALMAPTELLAEQHFRNILGMTGGLGVKTALFTASAKERPDAAIASGEIDIAIGTHALIQEGIKFKKLGFIVIDEQHRFGVMQRAKLKDKGANPHTLIMTATPIPRTLAMTLYGDLDYSVIGELPPGRTPVITSVIAEKDKTAVYSAIKEEVARGGQVYVVYPVIEGSEKTDLKSAVLGEQGIRERFPRMRTALVHGRMKAEERDSAMTAFKKGDIDILVSTTVIEVGVDVPNASLMVIVHAERFGLSQLHQLRGRVGRGVRRSRCILLHYGSVGEDARRRLFVMEATSDGFRIAEEDLEIRGPGDFTGVRQSGLPDLKAGNIIRDADLLDAARREAFDLVEEDPELKGHPALRIALEDFWKDRPGLFKA